MKELTREQTEYAVGRLVRLIEAREITQDDLEQLSGVSQSTISKIKNGWKEQGTEKYLPSADLLTKLFGAMGHRLGDILSESDRVGEEIHGYIATPLTGLSENQDSTVRHLVKRIKETAADPLLDPRHLSCTGQETTPIRRRIPKFPRNRYISLTGHGPPRMIS